MSNATIVKQSPFEAVKILEKKTGSVNSLNSLTLQDYPQPIDATAFHGLAGEIVRLIEPHTEADPAALLFQILAGFGNIIGRRAYMVADGSRHCLGLFGVLVGQSSKGRKGTSWNQIANFLRPRRCEDWKNNRVKSGLSLAVRGLSGMSGIQFQTKPKKEKGRQPENMSK